MNLLRCTLSSRGLSPIGVPNLKRYCAGQLRGDVRLDRSPTDLSAAIHAVIDGFFVIAGATHRPDLVNGIAVAIMSMIAAR
ncbi:Uncharacterised protein [Mycobacteroides abscessus subsp. bolletii]|uniref:hypothetical protein n=1 Tax=Mycobacteroides abscessus TaxID=36809 RepID=UPI000926392D|nr:hypothetical protein [Mycobacteroides abscessus]SIJ30719.1 Uncharacterised protein [Mycobacteroides abscessus subsp. bolletii]SLF73478.1 Uncharacterised protein [Mycobacteroides abscessus subsp. bolletii]